MNICAPRDRQAPQNHVLNQLQASLLHACATVMDPMIDRIIRDLQRKRQELDDSSPKLDTADILARIEALQNRMKETPRITFRKKEP